MATARERLLQALTAIISQPLTEDGKNALRRLLNSYRVQAKPGEDLPKSDTARDALAEQIIASWKEHGPVDRKVLGTLISPFRMQLKQGLARGRGDAKNAAADVDIIKNESKNLTRMQIKEKAVLHENAYFRERHDAHPNILKHAPIAGGPKVGSNTRGQCPKCRSIGIVLARAYGGDDYYSCIYCGFQSYLKGADPKLDLPLAAELLGGAFGDPDHDDDE